MSMDINSETVKTDVYTAIAYQKGFLYKGEIPSIREDFEEIVKYFPEHRLTLHELYSIYKEDDKEKAEDYLLKLVSKYPHDHEYLFELLLLYSNYSNDNWDKQKDIESIFSKLKKYGYETPSFLKWQAEQALLFNDVISSISFLKKSLSIYKNDQKSRIKIAKLYYLIGEFKLSYENLLKINPVEKNATLYRIEGICNFFLENFKNALKLLESVILVEPNDVYALYFLGDIEERQRHSWKSDNYFTKIISRSSFSTDEMAVASLAFLILNETPRAEQCIEMNLQNSPDHMYSRFVHGIIMLSQKKFHKAYESFNEVYDCDYFLLKREFSLIKKSLKKSLIDEFLKFVEKHDENLYLFFSLDLNREIFSEKAEILDDNKIDSV